MKRSGIRVYKSQLNPIPNAMNHENNPAKIQSLRHVYPGLRRRAASSGLRWLANNVKTRISLLLILPVLGVYLNCI